MSGLGPVVVKRREKDDVLRNAHTVDKEVAEHRPRRIRYDPINRCLPVHEIATLSDLAPASVHVVRN